MLDHKELNMFRGQLADASAPSTRVGAPSVSSQACAVASKRANDKGGGR